MATQAQIEANRRNAQKSTGPKTLEGRAAVRFNSVKHGLTAGALTLAGEDEAEFEALLDSMEAEHQPATPTEAVLVRRIAMASWRLNRFYHIEAGFFVIRQLDLERDFESYTNLEPGDRLAIVVRDDSLVAKTLPNLTLYASRLERSMDKALSELRRLRAARCSEMKKQTQSTPAQPPPEPSRRPKLPLATTNQHPTPDIENPPSPSCQNECNDRTSSPGGVSQELPGGPL